MSRSVPWLAVLLLAGCQRGEPRVVVYCAQDREFAEGIFADFAGETGVAVAPKFDTEANKSVALAAELEREAGRPRADVHWNNEILGTIRLARRGVYEPYRSPAATGFPEWTRPADGAWQAFAARARVLIVNTDLVPNPADLPASLFDLLNPKWNGKVAIAKPLFGTTATHAACLFAALGPDPAKDFFRRLKANNVGIVPGNKQAATQVSAGRFAVGLTDTDDALIEVNAGKPVAIVFPDRDGHPAHPNLGVLYVPNTLAVVRNGPNPAAARKLVDSLLSERTEARLAAGGGFQIPLNPRVTARLPESLLVPAKVKVMAVDFEKAADEWDAVQAFLRDEFAR